MSVLSTNSSIVVATADDVLRSMLTGFFERLDFVVNLPEGRAAVELAICEDHVRMIVLDDAIEGAGALLAKSRRIRSRVPVIMLVETNAVNAAVEYMRDGALDCLTKPVDFERLAKLVKANMMLNVNDTVDMGEPQRQLSGYTIICEIGGGSMGVIYLASKGDQRVALKVLRPTTKDPEEREEIRARFEREARAISEIRHPNIVRIHEYGFSESRGVPFIAMELLAGIPLTDFALRHSATLDYRQKTRIVLQLAEALAVIHSHGICHRDIKPNNILVDSESKVTLTDFGVAYIPGSDLTVTGEMIGSPAYMAPEAFQSPRIDARADIFALGIVMYEFYVGTHPFIGRGIAETAARINHEKPVEPRQLDEAFPPRLQIMLGKMLRKSPRDRYQSMSSVIAELNAYLDDVSGRGTGVWSRSLLDIRIAVLKQDWL